MPACREIRCATRTSELAALVLGLACTAEAPPPATSTAAKANDGMAGAYCQVLDADGFLARCAFASRAACEAAGAPASTCRTRPAEAHCFTFRLSGPERANCYLEAAPCEAQRAIFHPPGLLSLSATCSKNRL